MRYERYIKKYFDVDIVYSEVRNNLFKNTLFFLFFLRQLFEIRHGLMLLWFTYLMNVTEEVTIHRPNVPTLLSNAFIRGDLNATTRGPFI